jgi:glycosyltransferase involved in cell wall biosynthesis
VKQLAILHYHLRPGGITTVIRNAQRALSNDFEIKILADFGYDDQPARSPGAFLRESRTLMRRLEDRLHGVDILHGHNLTLGKHPRLTCALKLLAEQGRLRILNQIHDFVEDERPVQLRALRYCTGRRDDSFWRSICYYDLPNVLWATLTTRAAEKLAERGVPAEVIRVLPNPVDTAFLTQPKPSRQHLGEAVRKIAVFARRHHYDFDPRRKILLSPIKLMVRKNNAETVELLKQLNTLCNRDKYQLLMSLEAPSPDDRRYGESLKRKVRRERLPVVIGVGEEVDLLAQFHLAHAIVTTSKMEGFGYAFMEGWLCGKLVVGRDIPEVTRDFVAEGMDLRHLYREFNAAAVRRIASLLARPPAKLIVHNRKVVLENYSLKAYAERFGELVRRLRWLDRSAGLTTWRTSKAHNVCPDLPVAHGFPHEVGWRGNTETIVRSRLQDEAAEFARSEEANKAGMPPLPY